VALEQARYTFYVVQATSAEFDLHAGNKQFGTQSEA
jgi:hypothetical protein